MDKIMNLLKLKPMENKLLKEISKEEKSNKFVVMVFEIELNMLKLLLIFQIYL